MSAKNACWLDGYKVFDVTNWELSSRLLLFSNSQKPKRLVLSFHGYGSNAEDLSSLGEEIGVKETLWAFLDAPFRIEHSDSQGEWFSPFSDPQPQRKESLKLIENVCSKLVELSGIPFDQVFFLGFSQGAALSIYSGLTFKHKIAGIICLSGFLIDPRTLIKAQEENKPKVPLLCVHGMFDTVVYPFMYFDMTRFLKETMKLEVSTKEYRMGHHVSPEVFLSVKKFIEELS